MYVQPFVAFVSLALILSGWIGLIGAIVILNIRDRKHQEALKNAKSIQNKAGIQTPPRSR